MIQVICPKCKGKGKVPCPVCNVDNKENQEKECHIDNEDKENNVNCSVEKEKQIKECEVCNGTGEVLCTACMGGGIMDTSAFA